MSVTTKATLVVLGIGLIQKEVNCTCWPGYTGNAKTQNGCQPVAKDSEFPFMMFTLGNSSYSQETIYVKFFFFKTTNII